jgi:hypothetical protein
MDMWIWFRSTSSLRCFSERRSALFSHAFAVQLDAVGVIYKPIEDGVGERRICDDFVLSIQGYPACNYGRSRFIAIFHNLQEVAVLIVFELFWAPVIKDQQVGLGQ